MDLTTALAITANVINNYLYHGAAYTDTIYLSSTIEIKKKKKKNQKYRKE